MNIKAEPNTSSVTRLQVPPYKSEYIHAQSSAILRENTRDAKNSVLNNQESAYNVVYKKENETVESTFIIEYYDGPSKTNVSVASSDQTDPSKICMSVEPHSIASTSEPSKAAKTLKRKGTAAKEIELPECSKKLILEPVTTYQGDADESAYVIEYVDEFSGNGAAVVAPADHMQMDQSESCKLKQQPAKPSKAARAKRKKGPEEKPKLSGYNKKRILEHLKTHGSSAEVFEEAIKDFGVSREEVLEFFSKQIKNAEAWAYQECPRNVFHEAEDWLTALRSKGVPDKTFYEPAVIINEIVQRETHPDPKLLGGIDLKAAYKFLNNALLGLPQPDLDVETQEFLSNQTMDLFNEIESSALQTDSTSMLEEYKKRKPGKSHKSYDKLMMSIDPLGLMRKHASADVETRHESESD